MTGTFHHPATRTVGSASARLLASFEGLSADELMETYERFEDQATAADLAADQAPGIADELQGQFGPEDGW